MNSAKNKHTGEIVSAAALTKMPYVDTEAYVCPGCEVKVSPCSYKKTNEKSPYFSMKPPNKHKTECDLYGVEKLKQKARTERVDFKGEEWSTIRASIPSKLVLKDERPVTDSNAEESTGKNKYRNSKNSSSQGNSGVRVRRREANTIRMICEAFIGYPYNRDLSLVVSNIKGKTYDEVFQRLARTIQDTYKNRKIFFAPINYFNNDIEESDFLEVGLSYGDWDKTRAKPKLKRPYKVRINRKSWSESKYQPLKLEMEKVRENWQKNKAKDKDVKGWLFFVGKQDQNDPAIFHVDDHRLICCIYDEIK